MLPHKSLFQDKKPSGSQRVKRGPQEASQVTSSAEGPSPEAEHFSNRAPPPDACEHLSMFTFSYSCPLWSSHQPVKLAQPQRGGDHGLARNITDRGRPCGGWGMEDGEGQSLRVSLRPTSSLDTLSVILQGEMHAETC